MASSYFVPKEVTNYFWAAGRQFALRYLATHGHRVESGARNDEWLR